MCFVKKESGRGFILAELLITIAIISIIAALVLGNLGNQQRKARDSKRKADLNDIRNSLQLYYNDHGEYPAADTGNTVPNILATEGQIKQIPKDPKTQNSYYYEKTASGDFNLCVLLENTSDPDITSYPCPAGNDSSKNYGKSNP